MQSSGLINLLPVSPAAPEGPVTMPTGTFTIIHPDGAPHDTVKIHRPREGSNLHGKILGSHISGPDNENDFQAFCFIDEQSGRIILWSRFRDIDQRWVRALEVVIRGERETRLAATEAYALASKRCAICGAKLTAEDSLIRGIGPICYSKMGW